MSWKYDPSAWVSGVTIPGLSDYQNIATDLHTRGANVDGAGYGRANTGFMVFVPGELPGTSKSVTLATWTGGTATLTIGAHNIGLNQRVSISSVSPSGYNTTTDSVVVTGVTSTQISYALAANPGSYSSGGTVIVGTTPATGMVAVDPNFNFKVYNGTTATWGAATTVGTAPVWWVGSGVPSSGLGANTDMYLNSATGDVYGPKTAGAWGAIAANIKGATGSAPAWSTGSGVPSSGLGANGDMYLNVTTGDVYGPKAAGAWGAIDGNIKGPSGTPGTGWSFAYQSVSANTTITATAVEILVEVDATSGPINITLYSPGAGNAGYKVTVVKTDSSTNAVTIVATINGVANKTISSQNTAYTVQSTGSAFRID